MASSLSFFSLPPHPTSNLWQQQSSNCFFTPQHQTSKNIWTTTGNGNSNSNSNNTFAPKSPSPLRTSRNANLMSSPPVRDGNFFPQKHRDSDIDEKPTSINFDFENAPATPFSTSTSTSPQSNIFSSTTGPSSFLTPFSSTTSTDPNTNTPIFTFGTGTATTTPQTTADDEAAHSRATQFQYSARARSSSPTALLQTHTKDNRDARKRLFLDRLRNKRDDARFDRTGDQVLRMDFVRERRRWEAEMEGADTGMVDADDDDVGDVDETGFQFDGGHNGGTMSPTDLNDNGIDDNGKEVEELAREYYNYSLLQLQQQQQQQQQKNQQPQPLSRGNHYEVVGTSSLAAEDFSDDGYDEVFMEILSQHSQGQAREDVGFGNEVSEMDMS